MSRLGGKSGAGGAVARRRSRTHRRARPGERNWRRTGGGSATASAKSTPASRCAQLRALRAKPNAVPLERSRSWLHKRGQSTLFNALSAPKSWFPHGCLPPGPTPLVSETQDAAVRGNSAARGS